MWDFPRYTSGKRASSFFRGTSAIMEAGAGVGARAGARTGAGAGTQVSRTILKIRCKSSLEYLRRIVTARGELAKEGFVPEGHVGWSDNLSPNSRGGEESRGVREEAVEERSQRERPRPRTEVILELISSKTLF